MNFKRIGRLLVCLLLVVCLIVNISPIKAEAVGPILPHFIYATLDDALFAICLGLGISFGAEAMEEGTTFLDNLKTYLKANGIIEEAAETMALYSAGTGQYYVSQEMVEAVRSWLFESGTVVESQEEVEEEVVEGTAPEGYLFYNGVLLPELFTASSYPYQYIIYNLSDGRYYWFGDDLPYYYLSEGGTLYGRDSCRKSHVENGAWVARYTGNHFLFPTDTWQLIWANHVVCDSSGKNAIASFSSPSSTKTTTQTTTKTVYEVSEGLTSGVIASVNDDLSTGYPVWTGNAVTIPAGTAGNDKDVTGYPIAVGGTFDDTMNLTQEDVWTGTSAALPDTGTDSGSNAGTDVGTGTTPPNDQDTNTVVVTGLSEITQILGNIYDYQQTGTISTQTKIEDINEVLGTTNGLISEGNTKLNAILTVNAFGFDSVVESISAVPGQIRDELTDVEGLLGDISDTLTGTDEKTGTIVEVLSDIATSVLSIPDAIGDTITDVLTAVFVPSESYVDSKVEALTSNFTFASSIAATGKDLKEFLITLGSEAPVIRIPLGASTGSYRWGSDMVFVDFSFYDPYKPTMDAIISAFLWLWFCWRMILGLPGLISGSSGIVGVMTNIASNERSTASSSSAPSGNNVSGRVYQTKEQKQVGSKAYDEWRAKHK